MRERTNSSAMALRIGSSSRFCPSAMQETSAAIASTRVIWPPEPLVQLCFRHGAGRFDNEVGLARHRFHAGLLPPVPVRIWETPNGRARQKECLQDAFIDDRHRA